MADLIFISLNSLEKYIIHLLKSLIGMPFDKALVVYMVFVGQL